MEFIETKDDQIIRALVNQLISYNTEKTSDSEYKKGTYSFLAKDHDDKSTGLVVVELFCHYAFIKTLIVNKEDRRKGVGSFLLKQTEAFALSQGCHSVWLDTYSFQAPEFYEKYGYVKFGVLPNYPDQHQRIFYTKKIAG
jgi:ribosomal protein S18 acetylase RimI-like enzyme